MQYQLFAVPIAYADKANRLFNQINQDSGDNLVVRYSANGQEPATYLLGGWPIDDATKATFPYSLSAEFDVDTEGPAGAYTTQELVEAAEAMTGHVITDSDSTMVSVLADQAKAVVCAAKGIQEIILEP